MHLTISPDLRRFVQRRAKEQGLADGSEYIAQLVRDAKERSKAERKLNEELKRGAIARRQRDLDLVEQWLPLEEEANEREENRRSKTR